MAQAIHLIAWFLLGCVAHSFAIWTSGLHPVLGNLILSAYIVVVLMWVTAWIVDDAATKATGIDPMIYYGFLIGFAITGVLGAALTWMLQSNPAPY